MPSSLRYIIALCACLLLNACALNQPIPKDFYSDAPEERFPPISVFAKKPSAELQKTCAQVPCRLGEPLRDAVLAELQKSLMFETISTGNEDSDYHLAITAYRTDPADSFAARLLGAATLGLAPVKVGRDYRGEFLVTWRGIPLADYHFDIPYRETVSLFADPTQATQFAAGSMAAKFIAAAEGDRLFSADTLYARLRAEDYHHDLHAPVQVGEYTHVLTYIYPDPFFGVQLSYTRERRNDEKNDIFIYPIRAVDWSDTTGILNREMAVVRKDIDLAVQSHIYTSAQLGEVQPFTCSGAGQTYRGERIAGSVVLASGEHLRSYVYLFLIKDKYVKFRVSVAADTSPVRAAQVEAFIAALLPQLTVPDESQFMAALRLSRRRGSLQ